MARQFAVCLTLVACSSLFAAPVPKDAGKTVTYFPTAVGAKWTYERANLRDETMEIAEVEKDGDDLVVSRKGADGTVSDYTKVIVSSSGLRQECEGAPGKTTVWLVKSKFREGESWDVPGGKRTMHGPEPIEVPAGKFMAVRVVLEQDGLQMTSWYAPGIGEVKRVEKRGNGKEVVTRLLKSFQPKGQ